MEAGLVRWMKRRSIQTVIERAITYGLLLSIGFVFMIPLFWMISSSLKAEYEIFMFPPKWIPSQLRWYNYPDALSQFPYIRAARNTLLISVSSIVGALISTSMAAMAFARLRFRAREALFILVLSTMMIPMHVTLIPQYITFRILGWVNSIKPLVVPSFFAVSAYDIFLLRQFFMTISTEMDDAARIDGCSTLGIYWRIILPLSKPALITVAIFDFMYSWNDFFSPMIYLDDPDKQTLAIALAFFRPGASSYSASRLWSHLMVASLMSILPPVLVFFVAQRRFIQGVVITGVKG